MFFGGGFDDFPGAGRGGGRSPRGPVDNNKLYEVLGVPKDADDSEIRKAYKKLALKNHPDKGGDVEKFKEISAAADILCDPEKRKIYDTHGMEGLEGGAGGEGHSPEDVFSMFFGGGGGRGGPRGPRKGEDQVMGVRCTLEELYNGSKRKFNVTRDRPCVDCNGRGGKEGAEKTCSDCNGRGVRMMVRQIGPGMIQQMQAACTACGGQGRSISEKDKCQSCRGKKIYKDRKLLEVHIDKGMSHGQKIKFSGEGDEVPGTLAGDIVFVVQEDEHPIFKRKGADLLIDIELELSEALCGFVKTIKHLDGRVLKIDVPAGTVTKHDSVRLIRDEGMPIHGTPFSKGGLFVHFVVKFPKNLPVEMVSKIAAVLPAAQKPTLNGEEEEVHIVDVDPAQFGKNTGRSAHHDDDDDEDGGHGAQRVQCGQN